MCDNHEKDKISTYLVIHQKCTTYSQILQKNSTCITPRDIIVYNIFLYCFKNRSYFTYTMFNLHQKMTAKGKGSF